MPHNFCNKWIVFILVRRHVLLEIHNEFQLISKLNSFFLSTGKIAKILLGSAAQMGLSA